LQKGGEGKMNSKIVALFVAILLLVPAVSITTKASNGSSYVIIIAPQEKDEWQPVVDRLLYYHPEAVVLTLPTDIQSEVMDIERQVRFLLMDGSLKEYLWYAYYVWHIRSIPVPMGYLRAGSEEEINAILYLDRHKAEIRDLFQNWFETELGYQPHYIALVGDIKTRRSDWVSALGLTVWWNTSLPYPADAWPSSINGQQVPVPYLPFVIDECLAWYGYAVGRITGLTVDDAVALVDRAGTYNQWAQSNPEKASRFLASYTVGVYQYYSQIPRLLTNAGFDMTGNWYSPEGPYPTWPYVKTVLSKGVGYWHITCHGNFMTGMGGPGNGLITFLTPGKEGKYYDVKIGGETPQGGWSGVIWDFINNDYLSSITSVSIDRGIVPPLDHTIVRVTACMTGSSEFPLQLVKLGAAAVIMGITSQEVCEGDCNEAYFWNALTHINPATNSQFSIGEAMAYANVNTHVLHYYYAVWAGMTYWSTMYLIGDPALVPYVPHVEGYPTPLDPPGNNPGAYPGGSQQVIGYMVPLAIEQPDGNISIINIGNYVIQRNNGKTTPQPI
jgi:hypothetical protein